MLLAPVAPLPIVQDQSFLRVESGSRAPSGRATTPRIFIVSASGTRRSDWRAQQAIKQARKQLIDVALEAKEENAPLSARALALTAGFLMEFQQNIAPLSSQMPYMTWSTEGEVVLEWRRGERQLIFYINDKKIVFLKAWGTDIYEQMEDGDVLSTQEVNSLWQWLTN